ncbi:type VII secretion protein EccB [Actinophytocola oryzae]|uniref:Type VII secretion protein EccB n=1 Tax=Actinophytocola oryzae TaxID=502181 RepID=A0A4R7URD0_9PSEU|nr:type VII secretion protein EccB [Actinophytocola oryzae]TDV37622.1 type VII secretion protein EccB [Actinophytocola oryzae]
MPSTPTTKSQVQAYRFVLRRMQSALVRKDAVMLHDPMRTHSRATIVGICIAAIGLLGFLIFGILSPQPKAPTTDGIVIGKPSGQVYVLIAKPDRKLVPVFNLASARLLLMAQQQDKQQGAGGAGGKPPAAAATQSAPAPTVVDDNQLRDIPKGRKVGIADGPDLLPSADQRIESLWTVCDQYILNKGLNDPASENKVETTVVAGVKDLGKQLEQNQSLLVKAPNGDTYLVYRTPGTANLPNTSAVRAKVDLDAPEVRLGLRLDDVQPRVITTGMLNAIPEKAQIKIPGIDGRGTDSDVDLGNPDVTKTGSVFKVELAGEGTRYYVLLKGGVQPVKESTADIIRFYDDPGGAEIEAVNPDRITNVQQLKEIDDSTYPERPTEVLEAKNFPVACLGWSTTGSGDNMDERTAVYVGKTLPGIKLNQDGTPQSVEISTPSPNGVRIDHFYMPPGRGAVVRQTTSKEDFRTGNIVLISDRGVKYGVPDNATAAGLGLTDQIPAPENIIRLLPSGASLSVNDVRQSYDSTPFGPGEYPTTTQNSGGG